MVLAFQGPPTPALLDAASVRPDTILLLDTFFHVVIFHGETIGAWREQGYQVTNDDYTCVYSFYSAHIVHRVLTTHSFDVPYGPGETLSTKLGRCGGDMYLRLLSK